MAKLVKVPEVREAVRQESVGEPSDERDRAIPGQQSDERVDAAGGQHEGAEDEQIIRQDPVAGQQIDRRGHQASGDIGVAIGEGVLERIEGIGVVEMERVGDQRVLHPARDPDLEQRVATGRHPGAEAGDPRPGHDHGGEAIAQEDKQTPPPTNRPLIEVRAEDSRLSGSGRVLSERRCGGRGHLGGKATRRLAYAGHISLSYRSPHDPATFSDGIRGVLYPPRR